MFLLSLGIVTVLVILLSQSLYRPEENQQAKAKTEQKADKARVAHISAPADVVPGHSLEYNDLIPTAIKPAEIRDEPDEQHFAAVRIVSSYFCILFSAIISPNAP